MFKLLLQELEEKLSTKEPISTWVKDFEKSKDSRFKNDNKEQRKKRAIAAYYSAQNESVNIKEYVSPFSNLYARAVNLAARKIEIALGEYERMYDIAEEVLLQDEEFQQDVIDLTLEEINRTFGRYTWFDFEDFKEEVLTKVKRNIGIINEDMSQERVMIPWVVNNIVKEIKTYHNPKNRHIQLPCRSPGKYSPAGSLCGTNHSARFRYKPGIRSS